MSGTRRLNPYACVIGSGCLSALPIQKPGHAAFIEARSRFVGTVLNPQSETGSHEFADEVMGEGWRLKMHPVSLARASDHALKARKKMFKKLFAHVSGALQKSNEINTLKGVAWETLVYAWAMEERVGIIKTIMDRFYLEDDRFDSTKGVANKADGPLTECLMVLFGLLKPTQSHTDLTDMIMEKGKVNSVKSMAKVEASVDIVRMAALGFSRGTVRLGGGILDDDGKPMTG